MRERSFYVAEQVSCYTDPGSESIQKPATSLVSCLFIFHGSLGESLTSGSWFLQDWNSIVSRAL